MRNLLTKVRLQSLAIVGTSDVPKLDGPPLLRQLKDAAGNTYTAANSSITVVSGTDSFSYTAVAEPQLLRMSFSSVPVIWQSELDQNYQDLGQALEEMTQLDEADDWKIEQAVYQVACQVAVELFANSYPAPQVFSHGPKSVVFNWSRGTTNLYLTISSDAISALVSSPERIQRRMRFSNKELLESTSVFRGLLSAHSGQPNISKANATSQTSDFLE